jgi:FkbM family methyltransferase
MRRFLKSVSVLGVANGLVVFGHYAFYRAFFRLKWTRRQMSLSILPKPVWLRPGVSDWIVMERIFLDREYDPLSVAHDAAMDRRYSAILADGKLPLIIDCGANIGLSSVWFATRFPKARIVAIEPEPGNFDVLALTAKNYPSIRPIHAAVAARASRVSLSNTIGTPWAWKTEETEDGAVETITVEAVLQVLLAVKIDIEGFETRLLSGCADWMEAAPLVVFEMHDWMQAWSGSGHAFFSHLATHKRDYLVRGENIFSYSHAALRPSAPVHTTQQERMDPVH